MELNELIHQRKLKLDALRSQGVSGYGKPLPGRVDIGQVRQDFEAGKKVVICGRLMAKRGHGKVI